MKIQIPEKLQFLYEPWRFKVAHGGRGGSKSTGFATAALIKGLQEPKLILCAREFQSSILDSVHAILSEQIGLLGLGNFYTIQQSSIIGQNGTKIIFAGLRHNISKIKSINGVDICWVEEAANVSKSSWDVLIPTIRNENSEIWVTFNSELETDETYKRFVLNTPTNAKVVKIGWQDNPWFPEVLRQEKDDCYAKDYDDYLHIWEGHCRQCLEGAVYAKEMRTAQEEGRICKVPIIAGRPIDTFWDLGKRDHTAIWFVQFGQGEYRVVDFYQNRGEDLRHYLKLLQEKSYLYGTHFLPHDGAHERLGSSSIESQIAAIYPKKVIVLPRISDIELGIDMTRGIFPLCYFDEVKCADGIQALRRYKYDVDEYSGSYSKRPLHDENSDASDAFRQISMALDYKKNKPTPRTIEISPQRFSNNSSGWMGI